VPIEIRALEREEVLNEMFLELLSSVWEENHPKQRHCSMNRTLLLTVVESYFREIDVKKTVHGIEFADPHKRAAFTAKWLLKFRPIQFLTEHPHEDFILANEEFAFIVACAMLEVNFENVPDSLMEHCLYHFRNHTYDPESWACTFFLIDECERKGVLLRIGRES